MKRLPSHRVRRLEVGSGLPQDSLRFPLGDAGRAWELGLGQNRMHNDCGCRILR